VWVPGVELKLVLALGDSAGRTRYRYSCSREGHVEGTAWCPREHLCDADPETEWHVRVLVRKLRVRGQVSRLSEPNASHRQSAHLGERLPDLSPLPRSPVPPHRSPKVLVCVC